MKTVEVWIYGALLAISVALAWGTWKDEEPASKGDVVLFDPGPDGVVKVEWDGERNAATLEVSGSGDDADVWVTAGRKKRIVVEKEGDDDDSAPAAADAEAETVVEDKPEVERTYGPPDFLAFPGSQQAINLVGQYSPFKALRKFDQLTDEDLAAMGLAEPKGRLVLQGSGDRAIELEVGDKAYGSSDTYVRPVGGSSVYLVSSKDLGPLRSASSSLRDRDPLGFEPTATAAATVTAGAGQQVAVKHEGRHDKDNSYWLPTDSEERDAVIDGLMKAVLGLKVAAYLKDEDQPAEPTLEPVISVVFTDEAGQSMGQLEVARTIDDRRSRDDDVVYRYFARSHRLRGSWANVSRSSAEEVSDALEGVLSR